MANRLAVMTEGQIVQIGTPQDVYEFPTFVSSPASSAVLNLFSATIVIDEPDHAAIESDQLSRQPVRQLTA